MIKCGRRPCIGLVAIFTDVVGRQMVRRFTGCLRSIMAADAIGRDARMIKCGT